MAERDNTVLPLEPTSIIPMIRIRRYTHGPGRRHEALLNFKELAPGSPEGTHYYYPPEQQPSNRPVHPSPHKRPQSQYRPAPPTCTEEATHQGDERFTKWSWWIRSPSNTPTKNVETLKR